MEAHPCSPAAGSACCPDGVEEHGMSGLSDRRDCGACFECVLSLDPSPLGPLSLSLNVVVDRVGSH